MGILIDQKSRILVQGITGREGGFHAKSCVDYGTNVVAGVTPGRGGQTVEGNIPVFDSVAEAVGKTGANVSLIFVPARAAMDAVVEAADAQIELVVCISEGIPVQDMVKLDRHLDNKGVRLIGPNCPGLINPGSACKVGIMPGSIHLPGRTGVVSRSGTLTYEAVAQLTELGLGQYSCVGIGGDPIIGTDFVDVLRLFEDDLDTDQVVLIGEIGGDMEQHAAAYIKDKFSKPICALIVGTTAPPGKRMGHAGAIITGDSGRAESKVKALRDAGATIVPTPADIGETVQNLIKSHKR